MADGATWRRRRRQLSGSIAVHGLATTGWRIGTAIAQVVAPLVGRTAPDSPGAPRAFRTAEAPLVTVVAVVSDADQHLSIDLWKLQRRRFCRWECVLVDDASEDRTLEIAQRFARQDDRFTVLANRRRLGVDRSETIAGTIASTDTIVALDAFEAWPARLMGRWAPRVRRSSAALRKAPIPRLPVDRWGDVDRVAAWPDEIEASADIVRGAVILIAEAEYHIAELGPLADELSHRGHRVEFMAAPRTGRGTRYAIGRHAPRILGFDPDRIVTAAAVVTLNDWGKCRPLVEAARSAGVATFAKVEGVQDFDDVDTGRERRPYRTSEFVLAQGANDVAALVGQPCAVVGSERLEKIWRSPVAPDSERALINVNFTYDVLVDERDRWLAMVEQALRATELPGLVSRHPADRGPVGGLEVSRRPFRFEASRGGVLISRFSTVPFEAMARGMEFVYFNPHGERVPTFTEPAGAFHTARTNDELERGLQRRNEQSPLQRRERAEDFFRAQVDMVDGRTPAVRTADVIEDVLAGRQRPA